MTPAPSDALPRPEFSRLVALDSVGPAGTQFEIEASEGERAALATRFGIIGVAALRAEIRLSWRARGLRLHLEGRLHAEAVQECVVTLDPVHEHIDTPVEVVFERHGGREDELVIDPEDAPEPLPEDALDIGEVIAEELALSLDPYPRTPGLAPARFSTEANGTPSEDSPFGVLGRLRSRHREH